MLSIATLNWQLTSIRTLLRPCTAGRGFPRAADAVVVWRRLCDMGSPHHHVPRCMHITCAPCCAYDVVLPIGKCLIHLVSVSCTLRTASET